MTARIRVRELGKMPEQDRMASRACADRRVPGPSCEHRPHDGDERRRERGDERSRTESREHLARALHAQHPEHDGDAVQHRREERGHPHRLPVARGRLTYGTLWP